MPDWAREVEYVGKKTVVLVNLEQLDRLRLGGEKSLMSLHGAACHNCLFLPETSCERGNRYLDRAVLVPTMEHAEFAFLDAGRAGMPGE